MDQRTPDDFDPGARRRHGRRRPRPARLVSHGKGGRPSAYSDHDCARRAEPRGCRGLELTGSASRRLAADHFFYLPGALFLPVRLRQEMDLAVAVAALAERSLAITRAQE